MSALRFLPLDGTDTIGGSKFLWQFDELNVLLDFGMNFKKINQYYEEYLKPRASLGISDQIVMGVLPNVRGLYRPDAILPDLNLNGPIVERIDAVLLSHAHTDHCGDIGFLRTDIPIMTSALSAVTMKAMQDSGKSEIGSSYVYSSKRDKCQKDGNWIVKSPSKDTVADRRPICILKNEMTRQFETFWNPTNEIPSEGGACRKLKPGELLKEVPGLNCKFYPVDHSIKGACGIIIRSSQGNIVYSGDLRLHGFRGDTTQNFVDAAKSCKPLALIIEGTRIGKTSDEVDDEIQVTEKDVLANAGDIISDLKNDLIIADFGPRNIERLEIFLKIAKENNRRLVITTKDAYLLYAMNTVDKSIPVPGNDMYIYNPPRGKDGAHDDFVLARYSESIVNASKVSNDPGEYILAFSFFDIKNLVDIKPERGHYVFSSSEAHDEEQEIDFRRLNAWLKKFNITPYGFHLEKNDKPRFSKGLHASGHASSNDIAEIIREIDPEILMPVHTHSPEWFSDTFVGERKVILPKQYEWIDF